MRKNQSWLRCESNKLRRDMNIMACIMIFIFFLMGVCVGMIATHELYKRRERLREKVKGQFKNTRSL